jgi:hypothetical protein
MAALSVPPEAALGLAFRHSMIPRPASKRNPAEAESSPKSVIADVRFVSPGSSSCSSIERRSLPDVSQLKSQPRYGRGYSTSDGELSDPDSTCTSRELNKVRIAKASILSLSPPQNKIPRLNQVAHTVSVVALLCTRLATQGH